MISETVLQYRQTVSLLRYHKRIAPLMVILITGSTMVFAVPHMWADEIYPDYYDVILPFVYSCDVADPWMQGDYFHRNIIKYQLHCISWQYLESPTALLIPFNVMVPLLTYLVASTITKDRVIGLIAFAGMHVNPLYMDWRYSGTYDMVWVFFVLLAAYFVYSNKNELSIIGMGLGVMAKSVSIMYLPVWLITAKNKKRLLIYTGIITGILLFLVSDDVGAFARTMVGNEIGFYPDKWQDALGANLSILWQVLPVFLALIGINSVFRSSTKPPGKRIVLSWLLITIIGTAMVHLFTHQQTYGYRLGVFASFLSIYAGMVIVEMGNFIINRK